MRRHTFKKFRDIAEKGGFIFERSRSRGYELCTNDPNKGLGVTQEYERLGEAWPDIHEISQGISPLNHTTFTYPSP